MRTMFPHFEFDKIEHELKFVVLEPGSSTRLGGQGRASAVRTPAPNLAVAQNRRRREVDSLFGRQQMERSAGRASAGADLLPCE